MRTYTYHVKYKMEWADGMQGMDVIAKSKDDAYYKALSIIHNKSGCYPYTARVHSVTYSNGNYKEFR